MDKIAASARNHSFDTLKAICALLVVFIHCDYPYKSAILPITDVAVPVFFCISGYFVYASGRRAKRIRRIFNIFCVALALYFLKTETFRLITSGKPYIPSADDFKNLMLFNDVSVSIHLWYLPAYLYVLIFAFLIDRFNLWRIAFYCIVPLILAGVCIKYSISDVCPEQIQYHRNAYFVGLPYFLIGALLNTPPRQSIDSQVFKLADRTGANCAANFEVFNHRSIVWRYDVSNV